MPLRLCGLFMKLDGRLWAWMFLMICEGVLISGCENIRSSGEGALRTERRRVEHGGFRFQIFK